MTKTELIQKIAIDTGQTAIKTKATIDSLLRLTTEALSEGEKVSFHNFGTLHPWQQTERMARNPKTNVPLKITSRVSVKFRPGVKLLNELNK